MYSAVIYYNKMKYMNTVVLTDILKKGRLYKTILAMILHFTDRYLQVLLPQEHLTQQLKYSLLLSFLPNALLNYLRH